MKPSKRTELSTRSGSAERMRIIEPLRIDRRRMSHRWPGKEMRATDDVAPILISMRSTWALYICNQVSAKTGGDE
ncbi:hypothetical protein LCGC14_2723980 [marine sediment metagenome]|uniref:Uncharacterized protein n=1 Tax=marine sediment metagenome TaxID=412755 RepID=A0A0F8ZWP3_9ZZZZ